MVLYGNDLGYTIESSHIDFNQAGNDFVLLVFAICKYSLRTRDALLHQPMVNGICSNSQVCKVVMH